MIKKEELHINHTATFLISMSKIFLGGFCLIVGGLIYIACRNTDLLMFHWFDYLKISPLIDSLRHNLSQISFNSWIIFNLPAGLWLFSYLMIIDGIWEEKKGNTDYISYIISLPIMAVLSEFLQLISICPGTFDIIDLLTYILFLTLFIILKTSEQWIQKNYYRLQF